MIAPNPRKPIPYSVRVNWSLDYSVVPDFLQYAGNVKVFNMFVRAWNERKKVLADYIPYFQECGQTSVPHEFSVSGGYFTYPDVFPEATEVSIANSRNENRFEYSYRFEAKALFADYDNLVLSYTKLNTSKLQVGLRVIVSDNYAIITALGTNSVTLDRPLQTQPKVGDSISFLGKMFDPTVNAQGWYALIKEVIDYSAYFIKNREANGTINVPSTFFLGKPSVVSWASPQKSFDLIKIPSDATWSRNPNDYISYGPDTIESSFKRKWPREISILDSALRDTNNQPILDSRGLQTYAATLLNNKTLSGPIYVKGKDGWSNDFVTYPELKPVKGQIARLVRDQQNNLLVTDNPAFTNYIVGHTFTYDGTQWNETPSLQPDILESTGLPQTGDYLGPWLINSLRDAINVLTWTYILPAHFYTPIENPNILEFAAALVQGAYTFIKLTDQIFRIKTTFPHSRALRLHDRVLVDGVYTTITRLNDDGSFVVNDPGPFYRNEGDEVSGNCFSNFAYADINETETRWKKIYKIKNLDSVLTVGMLVYSGMKFIGVLQSFTSTTITLDRYQHVAFTEKLLFTQTVIPSLYINLLGVDPRFPWPVNYDIQGPSHHFFNPVTSIIPARGGPAECKEVYEFPLVRVANPAAVWGLYPVYTGYHDGGEIISGQNRASKDVAREYDSYEISINVADDRIINESLDHIQITNDLIPGFYTFTPSVIPRYIFNYLGTAAIKKAIKINQVRTLTVPDEDLPYVSNLHGSPIAAYRADGITVCRWDVPGGFTYVKGRNVDE